MYVLSGLLTSYYILTLRLARSTCLEHRISSGLGNEAPMYVLPGLLSDIVISIVHASHGAQNFFWPGG